jgi:hypothetical protein
VELIISIEVCVAMKKSASPEKTVLETILGWPEDRPVWQRDALRLGGLLRKVASTPRTIRNSSVSANRVGEGRTPP